MIVKPKENRNKDPFEQIYENVFGTTQSIIANSYIYNYTPYKKPAVHPAGFFVLAFNAAQSFYQMRMGL